MYQNDVPGRASTRKIEHEVLFSLYCWSNTLLPAQQNMRFKNRINVSLNGPVSQIVGQHCQHVTSVCLSISVDYTTCFTAEES